MTKQEGNGVTTIIRLADGVMKQLPREEARSFIDGLTDEELAEMAIASSLAQLAAGGTGNLLYESMAARLLKVDVATFTSKPGSYEGVRLDRLGPDACASPVGESGVLCCRPRGHELPHSMYPIESDSKEH